MDLPLHLLFLFLLLLEVVLPLFDHLSHEIVHLGLQLLHLCLVYFGLKSLLGLLLLLFKLFGSPRLFHLHLDLHLSLLGL